MNSPKEQGPINRNGEYSPVQVKAGVLDPEEDDFPPARERVNQERPVIHQFLAEYNPMRITLQDSDLCQLSCPGCYVAEWAHKDGNVRASHDSNVGSPTMSAEHIYALGDSLQDIFYLGVEPTLSSRNLDECVTAAVRIGATVMTITNGASGGRIYQETLGKLFDDEQIYKANVSLDSIEPDLNNFLRGKKFAYDKTLETILLAVEREDPIKINITVWPQNYHTILETAEELIKMGVKRLGFHAGSVEGMKEKDTGLLQALDPLAWRALCAKLIELREENKDVLEDFTLPLIYFTEDELRMGIIGNDEDYDSYRQHLAALKSDEFYEEPVPIKVCPSLGVPQVYDFALDGSYGAGAISLCNVYTVGANKNDEGNYFAHFNPENSQFEVEQDEEKNELTRMFGSKHLCPARAYDRGDKSPSDEFKTVAGSLFQACRYVSLNQFPHAERGFAYDQYGLIRSFHEKWSMAFMSPGADVAGLNDLYIADMPLPDKIQVLDELNVN